MENQEVNTIPQPSVTPQSGGGSPVLMPGAILWMIFGIISVILCWYGIFPFAGIFLAVTSLVFAILAFVNGKKMMRKFQENPSSYKPASAGFIRAAQITGLIGIIISSIMVVIAVIITIIKISEPFIL